MGEVRMGGHVLTRRGWVPIGPAAPGARMLAPEPDAVMVPEPATELPLGEPEAPAVTGDDAEADAMAESGSEATERAECPRCGKLIAVNKDGSLRKHRCERNGED